MEHRLTVYKTHDTPGDERERESVRGCERTYCSAPAVLRMYCSYHVHHCTTHQHSTVHRGADASGWADRRRATAARQPAAWETFMPPGHRAIAPQQLLLSPPTWGDTSMCSLQPCFKQLSHYVAWNPLPMQQYQLE